MNSSWPILLGFLTLCAAAFIYDANNTPDAAATTDGAAAAAPVSASVAAVAK